MRTKMLYQLLELTVAVSRTSLPAAQMKEIVDGVAAIFGASMAGWLELRAGQRHRQLHIGCATAEEAERLWALSTSAAANVTPILTSPRDRVLTIVDGTTLCSRYRMAAGGTIHVIALRRTEGPEFVEEERTLIDLFHAACGALYESHQDVDSLPRRCHATLELLLRGHGEKEIASALNLSVHTIHDYVKQIYYHFGVTSRAELLALWVGGSRRRVAAAARL